MIHNLFSLITLFLYLSYSGQTKIYQKNFYKNGSIESEGWMKGDTHEGYWKYYYPNGQVKKEGWFKNNLEDKYWFFYLKNGIRTQEGHFKNGKKSQWWLFYDDKGKISHKCQLKYDEKNGYCLIYENNKLIKASKFRKGKKVKEWTDLTTFTNENKISDLNQR